MIKLQYNTHILLNSKNNLLINLLIYISILFIYNLYINDIFFIECMKESDVESITPANAEYVQFLEESAWAMDKRIVDLENELKHCNELLKERATQLEEDIVRIKADNQIRDIRITRLENNESRSSNCFSFCNIL